MLSILPDRLTDAADQCRTLYGLFEKIRGTAPQRPYGHGDMQYGRDSNVAISEAQNLAGLLRLIGERTDATSIHILGYSAGAPLTSEALVLRAQEMEQKSDDVDTRAAAKIGVVLLVGADLDLQKWSKQQVPVYARKCQRVIVTVSSEDPVLALASAIHGSDRLGGSWNITLTDQHRRDMDAAGDRIEFLDMTYQEPKGGSRDDAGNVTGHFGWYQSPWVVSDVLLALGYDLPAHARGLERTPEGGFWFFPSDYVQRLRGLPLP